MPELPEVETTRRGIEPHIEGRMITALTVRQPKLRWPVPEQLSEWVTGARIHSVTRRGKYLLINLPGGSVMIHLGMSGSLYMVSSDQPAGYHDHVDLVLDSGMALRLTDPRRFGSVLWQPAGQQHLLLEALGPEPLSSDFTAAYLQQRCAGRKQAIKPFIMNSQVVVGVGNIYANEALFGAGIHPKRAAGNISAERLTRLVEEIRIVLARAIEQGGTTLKDFVGGDGKPGYFKQQLNVYGRGGEPCHHCKSTLKEIRLGQRSTVYCPECQR
ncbi:bifunctional DNA-formamidopyrimidine glycosylase/DNA-(apurinic or apyrimidinic site) lyase [Amphritea pacifica]|uniref:Formamidopyrimidine-DNA glycosylase n=1 Tax=Amphritea pacifica TaxID=2811233 RepID=A0ABS2W8U5_9GAMM|nr:bifunctional DNA-formamidopyrimidine glycosylase/DNA-(apurinic or apyrimidinic site) lyase [Amphritea pacifica]MBN0988142.1 bifunctional DNA-formamidopyrimidine glycosylase/DNA-(apurinic or apyrimidinic site) lyase [Amphritea pacifica]MBN1007585.1 bifunctional DNA-formamidopyrimidine glycosylase/DNA-(apurinic or apyrimidinic site) lyase [Amphritea pacifica]